jgi:spore germination protein GerM
VKRLFGGGRRPRQTRFESGLRTGQPARSLVGSLVLVLVAACSVPVGDAGKVATPGASAAISEPTLVPASETPTTAAVESAIPSTSDGASTTVKAYFYPSSPSGLLSLVPVSVRIPQTQTPASAAVTALLAGPPSAPTDLQSQYPLTSLIPDGTTLLGLDINAGVATVNLSQEFDSGGSQTDVLNRIAQVVFTLTQFPTVDTVEFELDGQPVTTLNGAGAVLDHPVGRLDYTEQLPAIFMDSPTWGGVLGNPAHVTGLANTFEATFHIRITGQAGLTLAGGTATATCGTGCWGTFDVSLPFTLDHWAPGTIQVFEVSAKDGSVQNLATYPVELTPSG